MRVIKSPSGVTILVPFKSYCYRSIQKSLEVLTNREGFETDCEKWRNLKSYPDTYSDIFDGEIWKKFSRTGEWYFSEPRHYAVMLNIDWFQPFKHLSSYSIGGIYLVVLNLPRVERFKRENVILVGIIPNMQKEPPTNTFIAPLISELNTAWHQGFTIVYALSGKLEVFRLALLCVGCDIPACRKLCGYLGEFLVFSMFL
ncbi:uncharacterized protein LOC130656891 [Hydractinia symbiolongicarpus]|uniref:uncharacterized protein LOC130656891 n=1 Tax=Hydractinia symbiolongicarpus TaxID=13093 RepID=UPI00254C64CA|nr:uncharacterized protein LOC130656891 [Hydractinia symbiolongicarpus]